MKKFFLILFVIFLFGCIDAQDNKISGNFISLSSYPKEITWEDTYLFNKRTNPEQIWAWRDLLKTYDQNGLKYDIPAFTYPNLIEYVNNQVNQVKWIDYHLNRWETPQEFLKYGGLCSAFALTKYFILKQHGIPVENMFLVFLHLKGSSAKDSPGHMVLIVEYHGKEYLLDNIRDAPLNWKKANYVPDIIFNENFAWYRQNDEYLADYKEQFQ